MANDDVSMSFDDPWADRKPEKHNLALFFHLFFRVLAIIVYLLCGWFSSSFISGFVSILLLLSFDFWTVKNVTGRLLVGLRWWNYVDDDGKSTWVFEAREGEDIKLIDQSESHIFWLALVLCPVVWFVLLFVSIFRLNLGWFVVVIIALVLNGANLYGYLRCKTGGSENFSNMFSTMMGKQVLSKMYSSMFNKSKEQQQQPTNSFQNVV